MESHSIASKAVQLQLLTKSIQQLSELSKTMLDEKSDFNNKMLKLNVGQNVQAQQVAGKVDLLA